MSRRKWPEPDPSRRCPECRLVGVHLGNCSQDPDPMSDVTPPTPDPAEALVEAEAMPTVEELARAMIRVTPPERHGQLCPAWVKRDKSPDPVVVCDCWIKGRAPGRAFLLRQALVAARQEGRNDD